MKSSFYSHSFTDLQGVFGANNINVKTAATLYNWYYKKKLTIPCLQNISKLSLKFIEDNFDFNLPQVEHTFEAEDRTIKFLIQLNDNQKIETVLIPFHNKYTICLSSQVGCAMNCSFCYTGTQGLKRNLSTSEIIGQFIVSWNWLEKHRPNDDKITNIVFMGQGEPLHNFDEVKKSCEILLSNYGASIGYQKITISTSGYIPGLKRWSVEMPNVNLALSLHSPFTEKRNELIPINRKYPINEVLELIDQIPLLRKQFVTYEYLLINNFNDGFEDAHKLGELLQNKRAYINLIPFNPFPGSNYQRPDELKVKQFKEILDWYKVPTLIRSTKGDSVLAACGQLKSS